MIFHIATLDTWDQAVLDGAYRAASLESEGFIHLSRAEQVEATANRYYVGKTGLVLLHVDPARLSAELKEEAPAAPGREHERFPHLYGPLEIEAVVRVQPLEPGPDGRFTIALET